MPSSMFGTFLLVEIILKAITPLVFRICQTYLTQASTLQMVRFQRTAYEFDANSPGMCRPYQNLCRLSGPGTPHSYRCMLWETEAGDW